MFHSAQWPCHAGLCSTAPLHHRVPSIVAPLADSLTASQDNLLRKTPVARLIQVSWASPKQVGSRGKIGRRAASFCGGKGKQFPREHRNPARIADELAGHYQLGQPNKRRGSLHGMQAYSTKVPTKAIKTIERMLPVKRRAKCLAEWNAGHGEER